MIIKHDIVANDFDETLDRYRGLVKERVSKSVLCKTNNKW